MATYGASDAIVPFLLELYNYKDWTIFLKNYLLTQDLWDVVEKGTDALPSSDKVDQTKTNAAALHAIHMTCSSDVFALIKDISSAREAWNKLAEMHQQWQSQPESSTSSVSHSRMEGHTASRLEWAINEGYWKTEHQIFQQSLCLINVIANDSNQIALHVAVLADSVEIVEELIWRMSEIDLEIQDIRGCTALHLADHNGKKITECLVKKNPKLPSIPDEKGDIPIVEECCSGNKDLSKYLYWKTIEVLLRPVGRKSGPRLLNYSIIGKMLDIYLDLLRKYPSLVATDGNYFTPI